MRTGAEVRTGQSVPNPRMRLEGVSVAIVLGGRESRPHGEGPHRERWVRSNPAEGEGLGILADVSRALTVNPLMGSPYAVKAARTVATGGMGKHSLAVRPVPTHSIYSIVRQSVEYLRSGNGC
jgi:hypothetical protein